MARHAPGLTVAAGRELASLTVVRTAGLWPFAHPSPAVAEAQRSPQPAATRVGFAARLSRTLQIGLTGLLAQSTVP